MCFWWRQSWKETKELVFWRNVVFGKRVGLNGGLLLGLLPDQKLTIIVTSRQLKKKKNRNFNITFRNGFCTCVLLSPQLGLPFFKMEMKFLSTFNKILFSLYLIVQILMISNVLDPRCNLDLVIHKLHCLANDTMIHKSHHKKPFYLIIIIQMTLQYGRKTNIIQTL